MLLHHNIKKADVLNTRHVTFFKKMAQKRDCYRIFCKNTKFVNLIISEKIVLKPLLLQLNQSETDAFPEERDTVFCNFMHKGIRKMPFHTFLHHSINEIGIFCAEHVTFFTKMLQKCDYYRFFCKNTKFVNSIIRADNILKLQIICAHQNERTYDLVCNNS